MNQALIKLTEERINTNTALSNFIEKAKAISIPLFPETVQFTDKALKYGAAVVTVNTTLDQYGNNKDVYKNESGSYCLHLTKLNEIAQQAGIQIIDSRIMERRVDETGKVTFINHQVRGRLRSVDGSIKDAVVTGKYDYFRDVESLGKGDPQNKQVKGRRKHAEALAESNALTRLYNKMIAQIPQSFTLKELDKPFLIPYVIEDKDELLKELPPDVQSKVKEDLVRKRLGIANEIYPGTPSTQREIENVNVTVIDDDDSPANTVQQQPQEQKMTKEEECKILADEFKGVPQSERTEKILNLIQRKGWKHPQGHVITAAIIEKTPLERQIERIYELLMLPDSEEVQL